MENRAEIGPTIEKLEQQNARLEQQVAELSAKLKWYEEQFRLAQQKRFGASSEKTHPDQIELNLFNEAEVLATPEGQEPPIEQITYKRRKQTGKRETELDKLPVETVTYALEDDEQVCSCCGGELHEMSTETRNEIKIIPAEVKVVRLERKIYACRHCEREEIHTPIVTAPMPKPVYPGSLASPSSMSEQATRDRQCGRPRGSPERRRPASSATAADAEQVLQISLRFQPVCFCRFDDAVQHRTGPCSARRVAKQEIFSADHRRLDRPFAAVVVDLQPAVLQKSGELRPLVRAVGDRRSEQPFGQHASVLALEPSRHPIQNRPTFLQAGCMALLRRRLLPAAFDFKQRLHKANPSAAAVWARCAGGAACTAS